MKIMYLVIAVVFLSFMNNSVSAQVYNGNLSLYTQEQVDFMALTNYTTITGDLYIGSSNSEVSNITNLDGLSKITSVGLMLTIFNNPSLTSIDGLSNLTTVGLNSSVPADGGIHIVLNNQLTNVNGLSSVTTVWGGIAVYSNNLLENLNGFSSLETFAGFLQVSDNPSLTSISGLSGGFSTILSGISIFDNESLTSIDALSGIRSVRGDLHIKNNPLITGLSGLSSMIYAADFEIKDNDALTDFSGLNGIAQNCGFFEYTISGNGAEPPAELIARLEACLANTKPVADAGDNAEVIQNALVQLDGSGSSDADNDPLTFTWTLIVKPASSTASLSDSTLVNPVFKADVTGTYTARLTVYDGYVKSLDDFVTITAITFEDAIEEPIAEVNQLPLGGGVKNSLKSKLQNALKSYSEGNINAAINQLKAFLNQLNNLVADGSLTQTDAQPLINYVNDLLVQLNSLKKENVALTSYIPSEFSLYQNYPNPFNPSTSINYDVPESGSVEISVYNMLGEKVADLLNTIKAAGSYQVEWNASLLPSGFYICQMKAGTFTTNIKMILLK